MYYLINYKFWFCHDNDREIILKFAMEKHKSNIKNFYEFYLFLNWSIDPLSLVLYRARDYVEN